MARKEHADLSGKQECEILELRNRVELVKRKIPTNGTLYQQATCAAPASLERRKPQGMGGGSKVVMFTAVGHYNRTLNRCLIRSQTTIEQPDGHTMWFVSLKDAFDGKDFGLYITERAHLLGDPKTNHIAACTLETEQGTRDCTSDPATFDFAVGKLMEGASLPIATKFDAMLH